MRLSARTLLLSSAGCAVLFTAVLVAVYFTGAGRWVDNAALEGFISTVTSAREAEALRSVAALCDPGPFVVISLAIIGTALAKKSPRRAAAATAILLGSAITTQLLKPALAQARFDGSVVGFDRYIQPLIDAPAFPSGHATAAMALALSALIVVPRALRPITAALGALLALAVGFAVIALAWHYPSDIIGGYLVATAWCLLMLAALRWADERWPEPGTLRAKARDAAPTALAPAAALTTAAIVGTALANVNRLTEFAAAHTAATAAAITISLAAAALVTAVSLADHRAR